METFDIVVLGGGPAGYLAGQRAGEAGLSALVIEKRALGGVCLNEGCIPSKALLYSAKALETAQDSSDLGVSSTEATIDQAFVIQRKNGIVDTLVGGVAATLKKNKVTVVEGEGVIAGKADDTFTVMVDGTSYAGKNLIIATGSVPIVPPISGVQEGLEQGFVLTNREVLNLTEIPKEFVVIGGGVIGLEMASYYNSVGSNVTVIEMTNQICGGMDKEVAEILQKNYAAKGVTFALGATVTSVDKGAVRYEKEGETHTVSADKVLLCTGRRPRIQGIGLESIGVYTDRGAIVTDQYSRTNISGVYAAGDVNGKSMLAHTAYRESEVALNHILGHKDRMRYHGIPSVIYTTPEAASVGETEQSAREKGIDIEVATMPMAYSGRYLAETPKGDGICKLIKDTKYNRLIGAHMIGSYVSESIYGISMMIESEWQIKDLQKLIFPHPTVSEIARETLFALD